MTTFVNKSKLPDTRVGEEGSAKRNILRKGGPGRSRKEGLPGQAIDDGSMDASGVALDEHDPNYDSEDDTGKTAIPKLSALHREDVAKSSITLSAYKKKVEAIINEYFVSGDMDEVATSLQVKVVKIVLIFALVIVVLAVDISTLLNTRLLLPRI